MPNAAKFADDGMRMGQKIVTDLSAFVEDDVRMQHRIAAERNATSHYREGTDRRILPDTGAAGHRSERMNPRGRPRRLIEQRQRTSKVEIRICGDNAGDGQIADGFAD